LPSRPRFPVSPVTGQSGEDIALHGDLRAVALMHLRTVEESGACRCRTPPCKTDTGPDITLLVHVVSAVVQKDRQSRHAEQHHGEHHG
jgi:hypothetical protein